MKLPGIVGAVAIFLASSALALERLEPAEGCYFGVNIGEGDTISRLSSRLGITPAVYVQFFHFPLTADLRERLNRFLEEVTPTKGIALITLEPFQGLEVITEAHCLDLAQLCATHEAQGIGGILIRFAHEMNGNWYPWCQQPIRYKEKFRMLSMFVHADTDRTAMLWAPHNGIGYPFSTNGLYQASAGSADFIALDTDRDSRLTASDDMYEPYYPGDDAVDWVGMTIYHWGVDYPWRENEMPPTNSFASTLRGTGHVPAIPDFYARYCANGARNKPLAIPETSAFFNPHQPAGPGEFPIKHAWWNQVFNISPDNSNAVDIATHLPKLKCINWFDHYKPEAEAQGDWVDWRISAHLPLRTAFIEHLRALRNGHRYFLTAPDLNCVQSFFCIAPENVPEILPVDGTITVSLGVKAATNCDLVVDLLDDQFVWQGGTRVPVASRTNILSVSFTPIRSLMEGRQYRWSIFLTPTGTNHLAAMAWHSGPNPVVRGTNPVVALVAYPPMWTPGSNAIVRVKYFAPEPVLLEVDIWDAGSNHFSSAAIPVPHRHGYMDIPVALPANAVSGDARIEARLISSSAASSGLGYLMIAHQTTNSIHVTPEPACVRPGDVFRFSIGYSAAVDCDLHVDLFDVLGNFLTGTVQRVGQGRGVQDLTISNPGAHIGRYRVTGFIAPVGQTFTQAIAWSAEARIDVVGSDYTQWAEGAWGVLLATDPTHPEHDPDRDGASNWNEFRALTNPRNGRSRLELQIRSALGSLVFNWESCLGRSYQLCESSTVSADAWPPVGGILAGTGERLQVSLDAPLASDRKFYRVQVTSP